MNVGNRCNVAEEDSLNGPAKLNDLDWEAHLRHVLGRIAEQVHTLLSGAPPGGRATMSDPLHEAGITSPSINFGPSLPRCKARSAQGKLVLGAHAASYGCGRPRECNARRTATARMAHAPPHLHDFAAAWVHDFRMRDTAGQAPLKFSALHLRAVLSAGRDARVRRRSAPSDTTPWGRAARSRPSALRRL
jgi:hypothetical protein